MTTAGSLAYSMAFERSPITLVGGIASSMPGGTLPILSIIQSGSFAGLLGSGIVGIDDFFASFYPLPGSTLVDNQIGNYPFANMAIAANAIIAQPLMCSLLMRVPVKTIGGYQQKLSIMSALQNTLKNHNTLGGTYTVATPSFFYTNCVLVALTDVSSGETLQAQVAWKFDFLRPLVTLQDALIQQNAQMQLLSSGGATNGQSSGTALTIGQPRTLGAPATQPVAASTAAAGVVG